MCWHAENEFPTENMLALYLKILYLKNVIVFF